jgi:Zn-dependent protease/CBS domain-containing protein
MRWSAKLGEFAGVSVYVHVTFLLVLIWVGFARWQAEQSLSAVMAGILFILAIFLCVTLHEFGHALTARRFGIRTRDITLLPIGGVARLERMPEDPSQELWVTLAGPAVNAVIAGVLFALLVLAGALAPVGIQTLTTGTFWERLMLFNVILVVFNMIPAFPMDGGRVLRALLAMRMEHARATRIATRFGQSIALLFAILGLFGNPFLILIAVFVWLGATQEAAVSRTKSALGGIRLADAMVTEFRTLSPRDPLARAVEFLLSGSQRDFPVVDADLVVGILTHPGLLAALAKNGEETAVSEVMDRNFEAAEPAELVDAVLQRLQSRTCRTVAVMERGRLIGLMTVENLGELIGVQAAMGSARSARQRIAASTTR